MAQAAEGPGVAALAYEAYKRSHLNTEAECAQQGVTFLPMVAEASGGWGPTGLKVLRQLAKSAAAKTGGDDDLSMGNLLQSLCVTIRRAKARAVLRRAGHPQGVQATEVESAAAVLTSFGA